MFFWVCPFALDIILNAVSQEYFMHKLSLGLELEVIIIWFWSMAQNL